MSSSLSLLSDDWEPSGSFVDGVASLSEGTGATATAAFLEGFEVTEEVGLDSLNSGVGNVEGNSARYLDASLSRTILLGADALLAFEVVVGGVETLDKELGALCRALPGGLEGVGMIWCCQLRGHRGAMWYILDLAIYVSVLMV